MKTDWGSKWLIYINSTISLTFIRSDTWTKVTLSLVYYSFRQCHNSLRKDRQKLEGITLQLVRKSSTVGLMSWRSLDAAFVVIIEGAQTSLPLISKNFFQWSQFL